MCVHVLPACVSLVCMRVHVYLCVCLDCCPCMATCASSVCPCAAAKHVHKRMVRFCYALSSLRAEALEGGWEGI